MTGVRKKTLLILGVTTDILRQPFAFGDTIEDTVSETKRAGRYLFEGALFAFAAYQFALKRQGIDDFFANFPYAGEIFAGVLLVSVMLTGLFTHPIARLFSSKPASIHGSIASFLYWSGFCFFVMLPLIGLLLLGLQLISTHANVTANWMAVLLTTIILPVVAIYYVGTITSWIARVYGMSSFMGGLAVVFSYALSTTAAMSVLAAVMFGKGIFE